MAVRRFSLRPRLPRRVPWLFVLGDREWQDLMWLFGAGQAVAQKEEHLALALRLASLQQKFEYAERRSRRWRPADEEDMTP